MKVFNFRIILFYCNYEFTLRPYIKYNKLFFTFTVNLYMILLFYSFFDRVLDKDK